MTSDNFNLEDLLKPAAAATPAKKTGKTGKKLESSLVRPGIAEEVSAAKGKSLVAGREPKSIRIPPNLREAIDAEAKAEPGYQPIGPAAGCGVFDMYHLLIAYAWEEYLAGRLPVDVGQKVQVSTTIKIPGYT
jgi:hypothetical protein